MSEISISSRWARKHRLTPYEFLHDLKNREAYAQAFLIYETREASRITPGVALQYAAEAAEAIEIKNNQHSCNPPGGVCALCLFNELQPMAAALLCFAKLYPWRPDLTGTQQLRRSLAAVYMVQNSSDHLYLLPQTALAYTDYIMDSAEVCSEIHLGFGPPETCSLCFLEAYGVEAEQLNLFYGATYPPLTQQQPPA